MTLFTPAPFSYCLPTGEWLYQQIQLTLNSGMTALVGRNGVGKSLLAQQLQQRLAPDCYLLTQLPAGDWQQQSIACMLGLSDKLSALERLAQGISTPDDIDTIGQHWLLADALCAELSAIGAAADHRQPCSQLSGGQINRLRLWWALQQSKALLILDEPSNHLDTAGRHWLIQALQQYLATSNRAVLLISHDRQLLQHADTTYELSSLGLKRYGGNYAFYRQQHQLEQTALQQQRQQAERNIQQQQRSIQAANERAAKRRQQGEKLRKTGSQATILLDFNKNRAQSSASARKIQQQQQMTQAQHSLQAVKAQQEIIKPQHFNLHSSGQPQYKKRLVNAVELVLQYGTPQQLSFSWYSNERIQLSGNNGSGKSTLLNTLLGTLPPASGQLQLNAHCQYLDQHFSLLHTTLNAQDNLCHYCPQLNTTDARTLLAGIGLRGDKALTPVAVLSGGERMKLAMLMVSQHPDSLLLLDEPDNHLDISAKNLLAEALCQYPGTFVVVSHDPYFVTQLDITTVLPLA